MSVGSSEGWIVSTVLGFAGFVAALVGGVVARDRAVLRQIREGDEKLHDRVSRLREDFTREIAVLRTELHDYKLGASREFVSQAYLEKVEQKMTSSIDKLANKIDDMTNLITQAIRSEHNRE